MFKDSSGFFGTEASKVVSWIMVNPIYGLTREESTKYLMELFVFLNAPYDLKYFISIINNIYEILNETISRLEHEALIDLNNKGVSIVNIKKLVEHLVMHQEELVDIVGEKSLLLEKDNFESNKHPFYGVLKFYPVYVLMINSHENIGTVDDGCYKALQGYIFISHALNTQRRKIVGLYHLVNPKERYSKSEGVKTDHALRYIRYLSKNLFDQEALSTLQNWNTFLRILNLKPRLRPSQLKEILSYVSYCMNLSSIGVRNDTGRYGYGRENYGWNNGYIRFYNGQSHETLETSTGNVITISNSKPSEDRRNLYKELDLDLDENNSGDELLLVLPEDDKSGHILVNSQIRHVVMSNQFLPNQWSQATPYEVSSLLKACEDKAKSLDSTTISKDIIPLIMIMFLTGSSIENVKKKFYWVDDNTDIKRIPKNKSIIYSYDKVEKIGEWSIEPHVASVTIKSNSKQNSICREMHEKLELPDPFCVGKIINNIYSDEELDSKEIFKGSVKRYRKDINKFLESISDNNRLNEHRISRYIFYKMAIEGNGGIAESILTTGRYNPTGKTQLHYTSVKKSYLREKYTRVINCILSESRQEGCRLDALEINEQEIPSITGNVGSQLCPNIKSIQDLVSYIKNILKVKPKDNAGLIKFHNIFTLYTHLMISYSTGYRAVIDPFPVDAEIDSVTGMAIISDKDGDDFYNSRIVWIPEEVQIQLNHYTHHRQKILELISSRFPEYVFDDSEPQTPRLFLIKENFKIEKIRPSSLSPLLSSIFPLPINVNRRFLSTELRERGCPSEIIDAFMGHWGRGQEPWGQYSSISIIEIIESIKMYIPKILNELGLKPLRSLYL